MSNPREVKILLVEDDDIDVMKVERGIKSLNMSNELIRARDGAEAMTILRGECDAEGLVSPFLVLLDIYLPRQSGLEFLAELRADPRLSSTVVFVLTTSEKHEDRFKAYQHNVAGFVKKTNAGAEFRKAMEMLRSYWRVVSLPTVQSGI